MAINNSTTKCSNCGRYVDSEGKFMFGNEAHNCVSKISSAAIKAAIPALLDPLMAKKTQGKVNEKKKVKATV